LANEGPQLNNMGKSKDLNNNLALFKSVSVFALNAISVLSKLTPINQEL